MRECFRHKTAAVFAKVAAQIGLLVRNHGLGALRNGEVGCPNGSHKLGYSVGVFHAL
jgi:hypothetical protein